MFYKIQLEESGNLKNKCNTSTIEVKATKYTEHLLKLSNNDILIEKEFICYLIDNEKDRIKKSIDKINAYTLIILSVIPITLAFLSMNLINSLSLIKKILLLFISYCIINIAIFIFDTIRVRSISLSTFSDLKNSDLKINQLLWNYYFDWQMLKNKADIWVSYVLNIENWIKLALILLFVLIFYNITHVATKLIYNGIILYIKNI
jgi:hypothetical protein